MSPLLLGNSKAPSGTHLREVTQSSAAGQVEEEQVVQVAHAAALPGGSDAAQPGGVGLGAGQARRGRGGSRLIGETAGRLQQAAEAQQLQS